MFNGFRKKDKPMNIRDTISLFVHEVARRGRLTENFPWASKPKFRKEGDWQDTISGEGVPTTPTRSIYISPETPASTTLRRSVYKTLPIIGDWNPTYQYFFAVAIFVLGGAIGVSAYLYQVVDATNAQEEQVELKSLKTIVKGIEKNVVAAVEGEEDSFKNIEQNMSVVNQTLAQFSASELLKNITLTKTMASEWLAVEKNITTILKAKKPLVEFNQNQEKLKISQKDLNDLARQFTEYALKRDLDESARRRVLDGLLILQNIEQNTLKISSVDDVSKESQFLITKNLVAFHNYLDDLDHGSNKIQDNDVRIYLSRIQENFKKGFEPYVVALASSNQQIQDLKLLAKNTNTVLAEISKQISEVTDYLQNDKGRGHLLSILVVVGVLLALLGFLVGAMVHIREERKKEVDSRAALHRHRNAVLKLLNELEPVYGGDLTNRVTVLDEQTATIADAINTMIGNLGGLVKDIKSAASNVSENVLEMENSSTNSVDLAGQQMLSLTSASKSIGKMETGLKSLASEASGYAAQAELSVETTFRGNRTVGEALTGMKEMQHKVEETSARVFKLKDTSDQIVEILATIKEITAQTSVLAINADMEAKRTGDKGFMIVANSVKNLADKTALATNKISTLVSAVKTDIDNVKNSMAATKQGILDASLLSEQTGAAFTEIEDSSKRLQDAIRNMQNKVLSQMDVAANIHGNMKHVVKIATDVTQSVKDANESAKSVAQSMKELKQKAEKFKVN